jgi:hypothetical protein
MAAALLAFLARALRCSTVIVCIDRLPPIRPPFAPCLRKNSSTSGGSFFAMCLILTRFWCELKPKRGLEDLLECEDCDLSTVDQEPENQLAELRRGARLDDYQRVRRPRSERQPRAPAGAGPIDRGRPPATLRRRSLLAPRSPRPEPEAPDHAARRASHARRGLREGIDATAPAGRLQMHLLAAIAEFERGRVVADSRQVSYVAKIRRSPQPRAEWKAVRSTCESYGS